MFDLLLINPFWGFKGKNIWKEISGVLPPLGIASIAAFSRDRGFSVKIIDMQAEGLNLDSLGSRMEDMSEPKFVGITATTLSVKNVYKIADVVKNKFSKTKIILGGHHPTALPEEALKKLTVDIVVLGEGEMTVSDILSGKSFEEIDGIAYKNGSGRIIFNKDRKLIDDINILPIPAYDLLPMKKYHPSLGAYKKLPSISMISSRGCFGSCSFCFRIFGQKVRIKSAENIYKEIKYLQKNFGIKEINFYDDVFTVFRENLISLCRLILSDKNDISWSCFSRIGFADLELLKLMKEAGCHQIMYGIESVNESVLKNIEKGINIGGIRDAIRLTQKSGIDCRGAFMLGNVGENEQTIKKTIEFSVKSGLDFASFNVVSPYPGTKLFECAKNSGILNNFDWDFYDEATPLLELSTISSEKITKLYFSAYKKFYFRIGYIIKRVIKINGLEYFNLLLKGFFALIRFFKK
ncbi:MAG: radical SAM protein [Patescibacteria group bacterium]|nr:radical SAM protein [Patescibacteria group bacterium]